MASNQEGHIRKLKMERKLFKEELEAFQEVLDKYEEGESVTGIQYQEAAIAIASLENTAIIIL